MTKLLKKLDKINKQHYYENIVHNGKKMREVIKNNPVLFEETGLERPARSFLPSLFIAAALPLRNIKKNVFERKYNNVNLKITGAEKVPFGKNARLLLSLLTTHSVLNGESGDTVKISYKAVSDLCSELQLPRQRSSDVIMQLEYFSTSSFVYQGRTVVKDIQKSLFSEYSDEMQDMYVSEIRTGQVPFIDNLRYLKGESINRIEYKGIEFEINAKFAEIARKHAVPINYDIYKDISSALGKDLYAWLCYRNNSFSAESSRPLLIGKDALINQFLPVNEELDVESSRAMRSKNYQLIVERLKEIKSDYYKDLNIQFLADNSGIVLYRSPSPIGADDRKRFVLVTDILP